MDTDEKNLKCCLGFSVEQETVNCPLGKFFLKRQFLGLEACLKESNSIDAIFKEASESGQGWTLAGRTVTPFKPKQLTVEYPRKMFLSDLPIDFGILLKYCGVCPELKKFIESRR